MTSPGGSPIGNIYDLGYQAYVGPRLGWRHALQALYTYSLRAVFGLGRPLTSKVFPLGFALITALPALLQLGIAAVAPREISVIKHEGYFTFVEVVLALFCAAVAPELMGRDQRTRTLPLYFSHSLTRAGYVTAKAAAMFTAVLLVIVTPQILLFIGNAVAGDDALDYFVDNADLLPAIAAGALMVSLFLASVSLAIASQTSRRSFSTAAVLSAFVVLTTIGGILVNSTTGDVQKYASLISPLDVLDGTIRWFFGVAPEPGSNLALADVPGVVLFAAAMMYSVVALAVLYRRYERLPV